VESSLVFEKIALESGWIEFNIDRCFKPLIFPVIGLKQIGPHGLVIVGLVIVGLVIVGLVIVGLVIVGLERIWSLKAKSWESDLVIRRVE
jgi:hypothetical protein